MEVVRQFHDVGWHRNMVPRPLIECRDIVCKFRQPVSIDLLTSDSHRRQPRARVASMYVAMPRPFCNVCRLLLRKPAKCACAPAWPQLLPGVSIGPRAPDCVIRSRRTAGPRYTGRRTCIAGARQPMYIRQNPVASYLVRSLIGCSRAEAATRDSVRRLESCERLRCCCCGDIRVNDALLWDGPSTPPKIKSGSVFVGVGARLKLRLT